MCALRHHEPDVGWLGLVVRAFCGALVGAMLGASWILWLTPLEDARINWALFIACVLCCAVLAARFGDDFWHTVWSWS